MRERVRYVFRILVALFLLFNLALIVVRVHNGQGSIAEPVSLAIVMILLILSQVLSRRH